MSERTPEQIAQDMRAAGLPDKYIANNFAVMDKDKHKELSSRGGKRSGEVKRYNAARRKQAKEMLELVLLSKLGKEEELQELDDFRAWQRHRRYLKKKREAAGKDKKQ